MASWSLALVLAGVFLAAELMTRTFYFLAVALAFALLAALDALFRPAEGWAGVLFVVLAGTLLVVAHTLRRHLRNEASRATTEIDSGRVATVVAHLEEGRLRVRYRGTLWTARLAPGHASSAPPAVGTSLLIVGREGNNLLLGPPADPVTPAVSST